MPPGEAGRTALAHLDAALARRPEKDDASLSAALRCLGAFRDGLVAARRCASPEADDGALALVNVVITCTMAVLYPLGEVPWPELVKSRGWLAEAVARTEK